MTYDYECCRCGHTLSIDQSIKDEPIRHCPKCTTPSLKRLISGPGTFVLKGDGWFADGYSKKPV
jgi:putative FmdB family regulatory protein